MVRSSYDVVVVGAGPVGSVAAVSAARSGGNVLLLEANPDAARRFAGEWIHPTGVAVLDRLRIGRLEGADARTGYGFVVFPDEGSDPIELAYPAGHVALASEHSRIVESIRERVAALPEVHYREHARVTAIEGNKVTFRTREGERTVRAGRVIGCDGRSSVARKVLGLGTHGQAISYMASVELRGVELPIEGYGHVVLGGPGPVLLYRIGPDLVRGCFDVPLTYDASRRNPAFLWDGYAAVLPVRLRQAFREALERGPVQWAVNRFAPRAAYGQDSTWLAGDSVGHFHPLTAAGMTLGFMDAELAGSPIALPQYQRTRERDSYVPELLSNALYQVFAREDWSAAHVRNALYRVWNGSRFERERTMRILMGAESSRSAFAVAFSRVALNAVNRSLRDLGDNRRLREFGHTLASYREWMQWPAATLAPSRGRKAYRAKSTTDRPLPLPVPGLKPRAKVTPTHVSIDVSATNGEGVAVQPALSLAGDALLIELKRLHERIGRDPDWALMRRATRIVMAIDSANLGASMSARMRLAKRPMARMGITRLVNAHGIDPHLIRASDFAIFMLSVLTPEEGELIDRLEDGVRHLLACQRPGGGFAPWPEPSAGPDYQTTEVACRALARCRDRYGDEGSLRYDDALARARRYLVSTQRKDGSWPASETEGALSNTVHAIRALIAAGAQPSSSVLRRATRFLGSAQHVDGSWHARSDERAGSPELTARAVSALLAAPGPHWSAIQGAVPHLVKLLSETLSDEVREARSEEAWDRCCDVVDALAAWEAQRRARPRAESVRTTPDGDDWTFCKESLYAVSRTFSKPIAMLPGELEVAVTLGYLLCRIADTIEDHPAVPRGRKDELFASFLATLEQSADPKLLAEAFDDIEGEDAELALVRQFPRVMRVFTGLGERLQIIVARWVAEMARGMNLYTHREPGADGFVALYTIEDLERYCYYVAGTVGHMLTELFAESVGRGLDERAVAKLRDNAEAFGAGLQLVNILKDVTDDRARRWSFVPRAACERVGLRIDNLTAHEHRERAHHAVAPLFDVARAKLDRALEYALSIPPEEKGIRLFCLLPLWMAALTLVHARGNDAMFVVGDEVKISRQAVEQVIADCASHVGDDQVLRARYASLWGPAAVAEQLA
jgi:squalene monooxygenase